MATNGKKILDQLRKTAVCLLVGGDEKVYVALINVHHYYMLLFPIYRINPVRVGSHTIYFRGILILNVVIQALLELGVSSADHVILTGCSGMLCCYNT